MRLAGRRKRFDLVFSWAMLGAVFAGHTASAAPKYTITDLGTLPGTTSSAATAINNQGQVVGVSYNPGDGSFQYYKPPDSPHFKSTGGGQSFLYQSGTMNPTSALGGLASDINDRGQIVGSEFHSAINDSGQIVDVSSYTIRSYSGTNSGPQSTLMSMAYDINNKGIVAGGSGTGNPFTGMSVFPTVLQDGKLTYLYSHPDPSSKADAIDGRAFAVNDTGQALVNVLTYSTGNLSSFVYDIATKAHVDLTTLPGGAGKFGVALNNAGEVVGNDFLYDGSTIQKLGDLLKSPAGWSDLNATDINDEGWIVGQGTIDGELHAFLMTPVPEPGAMIAWAVLAAAGLGCRRLQARNRCD